MEKLLLLSLIILFFYVSGRMEGYWKLKNTANHWLSIVQTVLLMTILYLSNHLVFLEWYNLLAIPFLRKVPFDYGYLNGSKSKTLLGTTSWDDIIINKLKDKFGKHFPIDVFIIFLIFIIGLSLLFI